MGTVKKAIYKCSVCGNVVEVLSTGAGDLVCCGKPMDLLEEKTADSTTEKHVPYITELDDGYQVKVGQNTSHPMTSEHLIEWIELIVDGVSYIKHLEADKEPIAVFKVAHGNNVYARSYCNLHGLWKGEL